LTEIKTTREKNMSVYEKSNTFQAGKYDEEKYMTLTLRQSRATEG
jgi:hypothetical protein